jgi:hypothetical protein
MEATIKAERLDAHAEHGNNPVNAVIENPVGDFPTEAFHAANEQVQARYDVDDFRHDGDEFVVGTVEYESGEFNINLN